MTAIANCLTFTGATLIGGALWLLHPAAALGWAGFLSLAFGVWLHDLAKRRRVQAAQRGERHQTMEDGQ